MGAREDILMAENFYVEEPVPAFATTDKLTTASESLGTAVGKTVARSRDLATRISERVTAIKEEKPLQILAVVAAIAFTAGFTARIWRATRNA
jgi:hypothetical protein